MPEPTETPASRVATDPQENAQDAGDGAVEWVLFHSTNPSRWSQSAHVLHDGRALCGGWLNCEPFPAEQNRRRCRLCERALLPPTPPKRRPRLSDVLAAIADLHRPTADMEGHQTCDAEGGEQDWPCETVLHVRRALGNETWPQPPASGSSMTGGEHGR